MKRIFELVDTIAGLNSTVLIQGETGTGKELIAKAIHFNSPRKDQKMVSINCGAIPENLLESELFGHVKGAFTGAVQTRIGRFEQANGGTIFLDEIGNMPMALQVKLLRVLQEREFERVGGNSTVKVDVRIIAATSSNLEQMVKDGTFREDLFYRLNVIPIDLPPLRERREDIPLLVQKFIEHFCETHKLELKTISPQVMKALMAYRMARQRASAGKHRRTNGGADRQPDGNSAAGSARRNPESRLAELRSVDRDSGRRNQFSECRHGHGARTDSSEPAQDQRQQETGCKTAESEAHDADRKDQADRARRASRVSA